MKTRVSDTSSSHRSRRGFVLITVIFIATLLLGAVTGFTAYARQQMRRVADEEFAIASRQVATLALKTITEWITNDSTEYDSELEILYNPNFPLVLPFGDWEAIIEIRPQNRKLCINRLFLPDGVTLRTELEYPWEEIWKLLNLSDTGLVVLDFLDENSDARTGSKEETFYANRAISDLSQLLLIPEITPDILYVRQQGDIRVDSFFTVYGDDKININLAPVEVLAMLDSELTKTIADAVVAYRIENPIRDEKDLIRIPGFTSTLSTRLSNLLGYGSTFFEVAIKTRRHDRERNHIIMLNKSEKSLKIVFWKE